MLIGGDRGIVVALARSRLGTRREHHGAIRQPKVDRAHIGRPARMHLTFGIVLKRAFREWRAHVPLLLCLQKAVNGQIGRHHFVEHRRVGRRTIEPMHPVHAHLDAHHDAPLASRVAAQDLDYLSLLCVLAIAQRWIERACLQAQLLPALFGEFARGCQGPGGCFSQSRPWHCLFIVLCANVCLVAEPRQVAEVPTRELVLLWRMALSVSAVAQSIGAHLEHVVLASTFEASRCLK